MSEELTIARECGCSRKQWRKTSDLSEFFGMALLRKVTWLKAQLKCFCTSVHSIGNKQGELETLSRLENFDLTAITETW